MSKTRNLTLSALAIALTLTSFTLFRSTTNLVNAFVVPLVLAIMLQGLVLKQKIVAFSVAYGVVILFFPTQLIFMLVYIGLASHLKSISLNRSWVIRLAHLAVFSWILFTATFLTDLLFQLQINRILLNIFRGNGWILAGVYLIEGALVLGINAILHKQINRRIKPLD